MQLQITAFLFIKICFLLLKNLKIDRIFFYFWFPTIFTNFWCISIFLFSMAKIYYIFGLAIPTLDLYCWAIYIFSDEIFPIQRFLSPPLRCRRMRSTTNILLASVAIADIFFLLLMLPITVRYNFVLRSVKLLAEFVLHANNHIAALANLCAFSSTWQVPTGHEIRLVKNPKYLSPDTQGDPKKSETNLTRNYCTVSN